VLKKRQSILVGLAKVCTTLAQIMQFYFYRIDSKSNGRKIVKGTCLTALQRKTGTPQRLGPRRYKKALIVGMHEAGLRAWGREREWQPGEVRGDRHRAKVFPKGMNHGAIRVKQTGEDGIEYQVKEINYKGCYD
jgi:hypothetical protein